MTMNKLKHLLNALEAAEAEFEALMDAHEWYVTEVIDQIASAKQILKEEMEKA